ncbi:hypothetical protein BKA62DRAFT_778719 [Auriculariales sp. MPI-PUGE-AT-0066]|nr:hypothetical protein BKA62DRAFT_778719 [Auriculariales sp. MPI-PUGE-AT-0066]
MDLTAALPLELKLAIAASVNRAELLSLAQVSRVWRDTSHIDDRFYLKVVAGIASNMEDSILQLQSLLSAIDHAKCYRRTLGIHLELLHHSWIERGDHQRSISAHVTSIMQAVSQSMEHVAILRVHASTDHETYILSSLARSRAPILRRFSMDVQRYEDKTFWGPMLFQGLAPSLRRIDLRGFSVGECPVPAFRHVHKVYVEFAKVIQRQPSSNNFAVVFPELRRLRVTFADLELATLKPVESRSVCILFNISQLPTSTLERSRVPAPSYSKRII